jgi:hypothetical protein
MHPTSSEQYSPYQGDKTSHQFSSVSTSATSSNTPTVPLRCSSSSQPHQIHISKQLSGDTLKGSDGRKRWLELSTVHSKFAIHLSELETSAIASDGELFDRIKSIYTGCKTPEIRGAGFSSIFRNAGRILCRRWMYKPSGVEFIKVRNTMKPKAR